MKDKSIRAARRTRIQDAANKIFGETGFAASSIEKIARDSEMSVGAIYLYFRSKDDLYVSLLPRSLETLTKALAATSTVKGTDLFGKVWKSLVHWSQDDVEGVRMLLFLARPGVSASLSEDTIADNTRAISEAKAALGAALAAPPEVADSVWTMFVGKLTLDAVGGALTEELLPNADTLLSLLFGKGRAT